MDSLFGVGRVVAGRRVGEGKESCLQSPQNLDSMEQEDWNLEN